MKWLKVAFGRVTCQHLFHSHQVAFSQNQGDAWQANPSWLAWSARKTWTVTVVRSYQLHRAHHSGTGKAAKGDQPKLLQPESKPGQTEMYSMGHSRSQAKGTKWASLSWPQKTPRIWTVWSDCSTSARATSSLDIDGPLLQSWPRVKQEAQRGSAQLLSCAWNSHDIRKHVSLHYSMSRA